MPDLLGFLHQRGPASSAEIGAALGVSQPTVSRMVQAAGAEVLAFGRARATRYAAVRHVDGIEDRIPLYRIDEEGRVTDAGQLNPIRPDGYLHSSEGAHSLYPGVPWFLVDALPAGYLGQVLAAAHPELGLPADSRRWSDDMRMRAVCRYGHDSPGCYIIGAASMMRWLEAREQQREPAQPHERALVYDTQARELLAGRYVTSSAGGEQPKFTAFVEDTNGGSHVIVKFSPPVRTEAGRRWADLLLAEAAALQVLGEAGLPVAAADIIQGDDRIYLETRRFDRVGAHGRRAVCSLESVDAQFVGRHRSWADTAGQLARDGRLPADDARRVSIVETFGSLIGNTDMHFGNLSLLHTDDGFRLAPVYDMLPMAYAPVRGEVVERVFRPSLGANTTVHAIDQAVECAGEFWRRIAGHPGVSAEFRELAADHAAAVSRLPRIGSGPRA